MSDTVFDSLVANLGDRVQSEVDLTNKVTLRTCVVAQYYFEAESRSELTRAYITASKLKIPFFIIGGGSNLALVTPRIEGLVVKNQYIHKEIVSEDSDEVTIKVSSGYRVSSLVNETIKEGWSGLQYHAGLPGTVGGAVYMNSKWTKPENYIEDCIEQVAVLDAKGNVRFEDKSYFKFRYDYSIIQDTKELVVDVVFKLKKADPQKLADEVKKYRGYRENTQPPAAGSSGCFFQNITDEEQKRIGVATKSAGALIDKVGLKGKSIGNFYISDKHANFILNRGEGDPQDLTELINLVKETVRRKFGVVLRPEVVVK